MNADPESPNPKVVSPRLEDVGIENIESDEFPRLDAGADALAVTRVGQIVAALEEFDARGERRIHRIVTSQFRIGREPGCHLVLQMEPRVSRRHARIFRVENDYTLEDNCSTNGTYLNGVRVQGCIPLRKGDQIRIGDRRFKFIHCKEEDLTTGY